MRLGMRDALAVLIPRGTMSSTNVLTDEFRTVLSPDEVKRAAGGYKRPA